MHIHRFEKIWLTLSGGMLAIAIIFSGYQTLGLGQGPPSGVDTIDPQNVEATPPFDNPGVYEVGENEYEVVMLLHAFSFEPNEVVVPAGSTVTFILTSPDVVHGFQVVDTNINAMVMPGHIQEITQTFHEPGEYLALCNEYCGTGHHLMGMTITVE